MNDLALARKAYAKDICAMACVNDPRIVAAFAKVPREDFVGPGPWRIAGGGWGYRTTEDDDPRRIYRDVLVALDEFGGVNNGQPSLYAGLFAHLNLAEGETVLHLGAGTGYYSAILAELVGSSGQVTAVEILPKLAESARAALAPWPQVRVIADDAANIRIEPADVILASAGATHPAPQWLDALKPGGRLLFPMTSRRGGGAMLLVTRLDGADYAARFLCSVSFIEFVGARDSDISRRLAEAFAQDEGASVFSLRRDRHAEEESCWLHGDGWCLSRRDPERSALTPSSPRPR